jgi:transposase
MFDIKPKYLYQIYRFALSDYEKEKNEGTWNDKKVERVDEQTGEIKGERTVYIAKAENVGQNMCLDDKEINGKSFSILSNQKTGKIAFMIDSVKSFELEKGIAFLGDSIKIIKTMNCDMAPSYLKFIRENLPQSTIVVDKFHVMKYVYDAVQQVRMEIRKSIFEQMPKGKRRKKDEGLLSDLEQLKKSKVPLSRSKDLWSEEQKELMQNLFLKYPKLEEAYKLAQEFKVWYSKDNSKKGYLQINKELNQWLEKLETSTIKQFESCSKMIQKHEEEIMNYFKNPQTNAKAERLNGKIERFLSNNYGTRDLDFTLYRIKGYFS